MKNDKEPPKYPEIGARLTQFIAESGEPNARQFALRAGLTPQLISHLAAGNSIPGGETLVALATAYKDFDSDWLLTGRKKGRALTPVVVSEDKVALTSAAATLDHATDLMLRGQLLEQVKDLRADKADLKAENARLLAENLELRGLGKPHDSSDAADDGGDEPSDPTKPAFDGAAPAPMLRKRVGFQTSFTK